MICLRGPTLSPVGGTDAGRVHGRMDRVHGCESRPFLALVYSVDNEYLQPRFINRN
jgi:hypothetical protein